MKKLLYTNDEIASFCSELEYLIHAGIGNADALILLEEDESRPAYKAILKKMAEKADEGVELSEALRTAECLPGDVVEMLSVGERSGRIEESLSALSSSYRRKDETERSMKSALLYPSILMLIMLAVIGVLLIYVMPIFNSVYAQLGGSLTGVAGVLLTFGQSLGKAGPVLIVLFCLAVLFLALFSSVSAFRNALMNSWQASKGDKGIAGKLNMAAFARALALGMSSGLNIDEAVEAAAKVLPESSDMRKRSGDCVKALNSGTGTADALRDANLLPASQCRILEAGIHGGSGEKAMEQAAERLTEESEQAVEDALSRIEPTMVIITSLLVGLILLSVMLPLINIMAAIG